MHSYIKSHNQSQKSEVEYKMLDPPIKHIRNYGIRNIFNSNKNIE